LKKNIKIFTYELIDDEMNILMRIMISLRVKSCRLPLLIKKGT